MATLRGSLLLSLVVLVAVALQLWSASHSFEALFAALLIIGILAVLELSLSFDNAIVNATVLRHMDRVWQQRFLTWGIIIAVFGMRLVLPVLIVAVLGGLSPWAAARIALSEPQQYSQILSEGRLPVAGFGGAFLAMVGLRFFLDGEKSVHWFPALERWLVYLGRIRGLDLGLVLLVAYGTTLGLVVEERGSFLTAVAFGLVSFIAVDALGELLKVPDQAGPARAGFASFLYLELLDASFSFDGVIGAFALSSQVLVIATGLGLGALFVRTFTLMLVENATLARYRYLEHGAFYAIVALAGVMFLQAVMHVPELFAGISGGVIILASVWSSILRRKVSQRAASASGGA